jgi:thiosulfate reductase cytochrome b subunit
MTGTTTGTGIGLAGPRAAAGAAKGPVIHRQSVWTRVTHWTWAVAMFFLLLTGLQIFMARPDLYLGQQSGFGFDNSILSIGARADAEAQLRGYTTIFGWEFDTTGLLGASGGQGRTFPGWATIPSYRDLGTGRVIHFFFAWVLVATLGLWLVASLLNGHLRQLIPTGADLRALPRDVAEHARLKLTHGRGYGPLQKLSYAGVMFLLLPLMVLTGLAMSPSFNAAAPWVLDLMGGRQTARTLHFVVMLLLVGFFAVHVLMVLLAGPFNEMRSMITGRYRIDPERDPEPGAPEETFHGR